MDNHLIVLLVVAAASGSGGSNIKVPEEACIDVKVVTKTYGYENSWTFGKCSSASRYGSFKTTTEQCCQPAGDYELVCKCSYGDGWHGGYLEIGNKRYCDKFLSGREEKETASMADVLATCVDGIKNQGEEGIDCGGPCWSCEPPINGVSCGGHSAPTCAECAQDNGPSWCNGGCSWDYTEWQCVKIESNIFCGSSADCIATETCQLSELDRISNNSGILDFRGKFTKGRTEKLLKKAERNYLGMRYGLENRLESAGRFAQSVWLDYSKIGFDRAKWLEVKKNGWILEDSVLVKKSVHNTFFATIVYGGGYAGIQQHPSTSCGMNEGFCGVAIFSLWDTESNHASVVNGGEDVYISGFGGEGTGMRSMKLVNWKPNQQVITAVKGAWDETINGWTVECTITVGETTHYMAKFQRTGDYGMQDDFQFSSFIEDWDHNESSDGCLYERSAAFLSPKIHYVEGGENKVVELDRARFTKDQGQNQDFCKEWSCADSGINFFSLTTGGARLGRPGKSCENGEMFKFDSYLDPPPFPNLTGPLQHCV